jgi:Gpi18-like mannosyltransferase
MFELFCYHAFVFVFGPPPSQTNADKNVQMVFAAWSHMQVLNEGSFSFLIFSRESKLLSQFSTEIKLLSSFVEEASCFFLYKIKKFSAGMEKIG